MNAEQLRALQAPLKAKYKTEPETAKIRFYARGELSPEITCTVKTDLGALPAGLHPAAGGDGSKACSGDMLLQALVACAGVTLNAVATAMGIELRKAVIRAEGELDFRGTLGVSKDVQVGCDWIKLVFELDSDAKPEQLESLVKLAERYCVVYQTLSKPPRLSTELKAWLDASS